MPKRYTGQLKELQYQSWNNLSKKINIVVLDYYPKYKINICEPVLK